MYDFSLVHNSPKKRGIRLFGIILLLTSLLGFTVLAAPIVVSETRLRFVANNAVKDSKFEKLLSKTAMYLTIDKIGLQEKIIPNVDAADEKLYSPALKQGVALASGSSLPGEGGLVYLFAHSTDYLFNVSNYSALFYGLDKLNENDKVYISFKGKNFGYKVSQKLIVSPNDLSALKTDGKERLIMQTCWPPGTTWQRLLVLAEPAGNAGSL